jgi:hypothetical protein
VSQAQKKTTSRRELARNPRFEQVSPEVGELDEAAIDESMRDDPDETMAMLADLTAATDPKLRELARRLAGRLFLEISRRGPTRPKGVGKLVEQRYRPDAGDLDIDASMEAIVDAGGDPRRVDAERLRIRGWVQPGTALCLMVDRSGSMGGKPLATSAVAAAASRSMRLARAIRVSTWRWMKCTVSSSKAATSALKRSRSRPPTATRC